ncbi:MAG: hypothetical protein ACR2NW_07215 [Thermodesulfobacteriota bacterium]
MVREIKIKENTYYDSLRLMRISKTMSETKGIKNAVAVMSTNKAKFALKNAGLITPEIEKAGGSDLVIVVEAESRKLAKKTINEIEASISSSSQQNKQSAPNILDNELQIINVGLEIFKDSIVAQGVKVKHVDWQVPAKGDMKLINILKKTT